MQAHLSRCLRGAASRRADWPLSSGRVVHRAHRALSSQQRGVKARALNLKPQLEQLRKLADIDTNIEAEFTERSVQVCGGGGAMHVLRCWRCVRACNTCGCCCVSDDAQKQCTMRNSTVFRARQRRRLAVGT